MAITDKEKGVWGLDQVYNKINQGSIWTYSDPNNLFAWGTNSAGTLGHNNTTNYSSPVQIPGTTNVWASLDMGTGTSSTYYNIGGIKTDGTLWTWGNNTFGALGQNNRTQYSSPVQIPGTTWSLVSIGAKTSIATKTDGTLWTWGDNGYGQLGTNQAYAQINAASSPVQIPGTWSRPSPGVYWNAYAVKSNGTLWAWGRGGSGRMAQNIEGDGQDRSSPIQIPGTTWSKVSAMQGACLAIKTNGTLWAWGGNNSGQLGQNTPTYYSSPIQIPGTNWSDVQAGNQSAIALKTDGTLYSWGEGSGGTLGINSIAETKSPTQIPGTTWSKIRVGWHISVALKTDGTLWAWGSGFSGGTGQNTSGPAGRFSSPVQIGTETNWTDISVSGNGAVYAINE